MKWWPKTKGLENTQEGFVLTLLGILGGSSKKRSQKRKDCGHWCTGFYCSLHLSHIIINSIKYIAWITGSSTRICSLSFVVISVPNSYYMSRGIHIFCKAMCMALLVHNITVICTCLSQTVLTFPYHSTFEWAGSKWQIGEHGPESGVWCAYRCCFEWLTKI